MGQCNDAYSAIQVAVALAKVFNCGVNDLPLTLVLSWYEQKAVCILLTFLSLGIENIQIGPSLPAFLSPTVLNVLVEKFNLIPIKGVMHGRHARAAVERRARPNTGPGSSGPFSNNARHEQRRARGRSVDTKRGAFVGAR